MLRADLRPVVVAGEATRQLVCVQLVGSHAPQQHLHTYSTRTSSAYIYNISAVPIRDSIRFRYTESNRIESNRNYLLVSESILNAVRATAHCGKIDDCELS